MYLTLEPCAHTGRLPTCADAMVSAGLKRVVCAIPDPNPIVSGRGFAQLSAAGYAISATGRDAMAHIIAAAKAQEESLGEKLGALELTALRNLLKRSIQQTDPGIAKLWKA